MVIKEGLVAWAGPNAHMECANPQWMETKESLWECKFPNTHCRYPDLLGLRCNISIFKLLSSTLMSSVNLNAYQQCLSPEILIK